MTRGTTQDDRFPPALEDGYFLVDEFRFEQLVSMSAGLAQRLRFFDINLRESGHWGELFSADETMVLARIAATDRQALQARFLRLADSAPLAQLAVPLGEAARRCRLPALPRCQSSSGRPGRESETVPAGMSSLAHPSACS